MKVLVLLTETDPDAWDRATEAERTAVFAAHDSFSTAVADRGSIVGGEALARTSEARTLRTVDGQRQVTDGPYAETVEQLGGFYLLDVDSVGTAVDLCRLLPAGYTIEVRPAVEIDAG
ncbi:Uncharacterized conserved protein [Friedmanniella luteola]|uniref:Uncharacterized conserved protein n=1 Tax=Friedmanniella luteola TaxID=546871 RepID=A0A1H1NZG3_9ACTN|nr:YciI family protein [Friedmanniella luteola]SDS04170.1 Uncharacterized conserved protein [Friedmanniella luteola]